MNHYKTLAAALGLAAALFAPASHAANETVTVNFALNGGAPTYRASGFIYGLSEDAQTPAQTYVTQIKTHVMRGGGSQLGCPNGGWVNGQFTRRWNFVKAYYGASHQVGAKYSMILAALWGADGVCTVPSWPGDNGDWTAFNSFIDQVISNAKSNGMTGTDVHWDIWNEADGLFWSRTQSQYLEMWKRAVQRIRAALPNAVIEGPSFANSPANANWWPAYLDYIKANNVIPNVISWHALPGDPVADAAWMTSALSSRGITGVQNYSINEYGAYGDEQQPGPSAWYIGRLERANGGVDGARANWGNVGQTPSLYATMGWLMTADNKPMGQWWVYKRYADQTGTRTDLTPSTSIDGVVFQDSSAKKSISLLGKKLNGGTGTVTVQFNNVPSFLVSGGKANVLFEKLPSTNAYVSAPTTVSNTASTVSGNSLTVSISWSTALDAYAITLTPPPSSTSSSSSSKSSSSSSSSSKSSTSSSTASSASSSSTSGAPVLSGTGDYPTGFSKCADEGGTCSVSKGTGWVAYGRKGNWVAKNVGVGKSIVCTAAAFGSDPGGNPNKCSTQS